MSRRHRRRRRLLRNTVRSALLLLSLSAATLGAQGTPGGSVDQRLAERLAPAVRAPIVALIDSARAAGLPTEPLVQKALQGAMRGADAERITEAVRNLASDLGVARSALGPRSTGAELEAGASAVRAGVSATALSALRSAQVRSSLTVALGTLADLLGQGVPVDMALARITELVRRGAPDDDFVGLRRQLGRSPDGPGADGRGASGRGNAPNAATPPSEGGNPGAGGGNGRGRGGAPAAVPRPGGERPKPKDPKPKPPRP